MKKLTEADRALIRIADSLIRERYRPERHHIAAALRTAAGKVYASVHVQGSVGNSDLCAEWGAISAALTQGETRFDSIVAVKYMPKRKKSFVVPPCGTCRELLNDLAGISVIVPNGSGQVKTPAPLLLPERYSVRKARLKRSGKTRKKRGFRGNSGRISK